MSTATLERVATAPVGLEFKSLFGAGQKNLSGKGQYADQDGVIEAIVSVTGIEDEVKDIIVPGAYSKTLSARLPKGLINHDWACPVSKTLEIVELMPGDKGLPKTTARGEPWPREAGALKVVTQYNLDTQMGRDAYSNVKFYDSEQEWSIGYNVPTGGARKDHKSGLRYLQTLDLFEYSSVLFGAMPLAGTTGFKSYGGIVIGQPEVKALAGSFEERSRALDDALTVMYRSEGDGEVDYYGYVVATFDDRVVYCRHEGGVRQEYEAPYTFADGEATIGEATPVKVVESVEPDTEPVNVDELPADETDVEYKDSKAAEETEESKRDPIGDALIDPDGDVAGYISPSEIVSSRAMRAWL